MRLLKRLYLGWCFLWFLIPMLFFMPLFYLARPTPRWHATIGYLHKLWAKIFFFCVGIPYRVEYKFELDAGPYVFCANHTSYLDIASMGLIPKGPFIFIGKDSLSKVPLFGYLYHKFHILVNRESKFSSYKAMLKAMEALGEGKNVIIFPEGGIKGTPPLLNEFKEGPFRIAIEKGVPIVPVTFLDNWKIFPKSDMTVASWFPGRAIVHCPILTENMHINQLDDLKKQVYDIIYQDLAEYYPHYDEHRKRYAKKNSTTSKAEL